MFNKKVLLLSHHNEVPGLGQKVASYLKRHFQSLVFISNPLSPKSFNTSFILIKDKEIRYKIPRFLQYPFEGLISFYEFKKGFKRRFKFDLILCLDPLSLFQAYFFKKLGVTKKIIYFCVDYSTKRHPNWLLNSIYNLLNRFAYKVCDYFFYLTKTFIDDVDPQNKLIDKTYFITHTVHFENHCSIKKTPNSIIFTGNITYGVDFKNLLKACIKLRHESINFTFDIYGDGDKKAEYEKLVSRSHVSDVIHFKGTVDNTKLIEELLPSYSIGVAPYILKKYSSSSSPSHIFVSQGLSTKIVDYIGAGLPVIATPLHQDFENIEVNKFGFLVESSAQWYTALRRLLTDHQLATKYSKNAYHYAKHYDEEKVLTPIFKKIL